MDERALTGLIEKKLAGPFLCVKVIKYNERKHLLLDLITVLDLIEINRILIRPFSFQLCFWGVLILWLEFSVPMRCWDAWGDSLICHPMAKKTILSKKAINAKTLHKFALHRFLDLLKSRLFYLYIIMNRWFFGYFIPNCILWAGILNQYSKAFIAFSSLQALILLLMKNMKISYIIW